MSNAARRTPFAIAALLLLLGPAAWFAWWATRGDATDSSSSLAERIRERAVAPTSSDPAVVERAPPLAPESPEASRELVGDETPAEAETNFPTPADDALRNRIVRVRVVRAGDETPVAFATIISVLIERGRRQTVRFLADESGRVDVPVVRDTGFTLRVEPPGDALLPAAVDFDPKTKPAPEEGAELVVRLEREARPRTWLRVVARGDRRGVPHALVFARLRGTGASSFDPLEDVVTDAGGFAEVPMFTRPTQEIEVAAEGYAKAISTLRIGAHDRRDHPLVVVLDGASRVVGTLARADGRPLADVRITVDVDRDVVQQGAASVHAGAESRNYRVARVDTAEDGHFEVDGLPSGAELSFEALIERNVEAELRLTLAPGETRHVEWRIPDPVTLRGRVVLPDGRPSHDAIVRLAPTSASFIQTPGPTIVEDDGTFALRSVRPGEWRLSANERESGLSSSIRLVIEPGVPPAFVELALVQPVVLRGRVRFHDGRPASGARVTFVPADESFPTGRTDTDDDGAFEIGELAPGAGHLHVTSLPEPVLLTSRAVARPGPARPAMVSIELPSIPIDELIVELPDTDRVGASISGQVRRGDAEIEEQIRLTARNRGGQDTKFTYAGQWRPGATLGGSEAFELASLPAGTWDVVAETPSGRIGVATGLVLHQDEALPGVEIVLTDGAWATVHVLRAAARVDPSARPSVPTLLVRLGDGIVVREPPDRREFFDLLVPAGHLTFELWCAASLDRLAVVERSVTAGELFEIELAASR